jgi:hypothetical protein
MSNLRKILKIINFAFLIFNTFLKHWKNNIWEREVSKHLFSFELFSELWIERSLYSDNLKFSNFLFNIFQNSISISSRVALLTITKLTHYKNFIFLMTCLPVYNEYFKYVIKNFHSIDTSVSFFFMNNRWCVLCIQVFYVCQKLQYSKISIVIF